jgi:hypothetical protein
MAAWRCSWRAAWPTAWTARWRASTQPTDRGGFLDITLDFLFYASVPLAFAIADPAPQRPARRRAAGRFHRHRRSFLAFAVIAERRGLPSSTSTGRKRGFYFLGGLTEATETLACFAC